MWVCWFFFFFLFFFLLVFFFVCFFFFFFFGCMGDPPPPPSLTRVDWCAGIPSQEEPLRNLSLPFLQLRFCPLPILRIIHSSFSPQTFFLPASLFQYFPTIYTSFSFFFPKPFFPPPPVRSPWAFLRCQQFDTQSNLFFLRFREFTYFPGLV